MGVAKIHNLARPRTRAQERAALDATANVLLAAKSPMGSPGQTAIVHCQTVMS